MDFITIIVGTIDQPEFSEVKVAVAPNPLEDQAVFKVENHKGNNYELSIINVNGKKIRNEVYSQSTFSFARQNLIPGIYFYQITSDLGFVNAGRIIIK